MTVIEVVVALAIVMLLAGSLMYMLVAGKRTLQGGVTRAGVLGEMEAACLQISDDLRTSNEDLITDLTTGSPPCFSFPSAVDASGRFVTDGDGALVWQKFVVYYVRSGTTRLLRKEIYSVPPDVPAQLSAADTLAATADGKGRMIAGTIAAMSLDVNLDADTVAIILVGQGVSAAGKMESHRRSLAVDLLN